MTLTMSGILVSPADPPQHRALAHPPVRLQSPHEGDRLAHRAAMAGQEQPVAPCNQLVERGHVIGHRSIRRRDDRRCPGHDVIGRKQDAGVLEARRPCDWRRVRACGYPSAASRRPRSPAHPQARYRGGTPSSELSVKGLVSPACGRAARCGPSATTIAPVASLSRRESGGGRDACGKREYA